MCVFIPLIFSPNHILFLFFFTPQHPPPLHSLPSAVIDGVRQQSTEQRVANSPRQPASERKERLVWWGGGGGGGGWGLNEERGKREGRKEEGNGSLSEKGGESVRERGELS